MPLVLLLVPLLSTLLGGVVAIRFRRSLTLLTAVGAGLLLGAAFLDLLPEALALNGSLERHTLNVPALVLLSLLLFIGLQTALDAAALRWMSMGKVLGRLGGAMLIFHSLRDGMAIGLAYSASHPAGYAVAVGIAAHDLGDGMNTVISTTGGHRARRVDYLFLLADAVAPVVGGLLTLWWTFTPRASVVMLAVAAGFFVQMATTDFLPGLRTGRATQPLLFPAVLCGAGLIYLANFLMGVSQ